MVVVQKIVNIKNTKVFYFLFQLLLFSCLQNEIKLDPKFSFDKLTESYLVDGSFTNLEILEKVVGIKGGYTIKEVKNIAPNDIVNIEGTAPNISLSFQKIGKFKATLILEHPNRPTITIEQAAFEIKKAVAEVLKFDKLTEVYSSGGAFTHTEILANITGEKTEYKLKSIAAITPNGIVRVQGTAPDLSLSFLKIGSFEAKLTLAHPYKEDAVIEDAAFEISKLPAEVLSFTTLSKPYTLGGSFATAEILANITGTKAGYTLKEINTLTPTGVATNGGASPNLVLNYTTVGAFTATLVLAHPTKADATITGAQFAITKGDASVLSFRKLTQPYSDGAFNTAGILGNVAGAKTGYTLKSITTLSPNDVVNPTGSAPNLSLSFLKLGRFTATLVLEHPTKKDATITGAQFEITRAPAVRLGFNKLTKTYTSGGNFTAAEILGGITGAKTGYTLKSISNLNPNDVVSVSGSAPNYTLSFNKIGVFTATLVLGHATKEDATITGAEFEITKEAAPVLNFTQLTKRFDANRFTTVAILGNVTGTKAGYVLKSITNLTPNDVVSVAGTAPNLSLTFLKAGSFTATLLLEHPTKADVRMTNAQFEITKAPAPALNFKKLTEFYSSGGSFSTADILGNIRGSKAGYTLKSITSLSPNDVVRLAGTAPNLSLSFLKAGAFTAALALRHPSKADVVITGAQFEITKAAAVVLNYTKLTKSFDNVRFTTADILGNIRGSKAGYTLKSITSLSPNDVVRLAGTAPNLSLTFLKVGTFAATLVLEHPGKADATVAFARFEVTKAPAPRLTFSKLSNTYRSGGLFTTAQILNNIVGTKAGYTLKSITALSPNDVVRLAGTAPNFSLPFLKIGDFTATLTLEHPTKADATITGAEFEVLKQPAEILGFNRLSKGFVTRSFTTAEILGNITGTKTGYTLKDIRILRPRDVVRKIGSAPNISLRFLKAGVFTATLILEHATKSDTFIIRAQFEVTANLGFNKLDSSCTVGNTFTTAAILNNVTGPKAGYTIKVVKDQNPTGPNHLANVAGSKPNISLIAVATGKFTVTLVLEHPSLPDVTIRGAEFEVFSVKGTTKINGHTYKTVKIGKQTWLAENLNESFGGVWGRCDSDAAKCKRNGRLYDWDEAMQVDMRIPGWSLPSDDEWATFEVAMGVDPSEKKRALGSMSNLSGFSTFALADELRNKDRYCFDISTAGHWQAGTSSIIHDTLDIYFWTSSVDGASKGIFRGFFTSRRDVQRGSAYKNNNGFSVRLIKDP